MPGHYGNKGGKKKPAGKMTGKKKSKKGKRKSH